mgnify:FL=1|tara:strand:+ start:112 stop:342 length:231 start_codon:yes stop_codon:yes gene_type:complete
MGEDVLVEDRLKIIFSRLFSGEYDFSPEVAGWTSVEHIELIFAIEDEFTIRFDGEEASCLVSGQNILDSVKTKLLE